MSQPDELHPAGKVVSHIGLGYVTHNRRDGHGNRFMFQGWASVRTAPGNNPHKTRDDMIERNIKIYDVFFKTER